MRRWLTLAVVMSMAAALFGARLPDAAAADPTADLQILKSASGPGPYGPGDTFTYTIQVGCSSTNDLGCYGASVQDTLPAPLVLNPDVANPVTATASPAAEVTITHTTNSFTAAPQQDLDGTPGLSAGGTVTVTVQVMVPTTASADFDGTTITNTADATATNADKVSAQAKVSLAIPTTLVADLTKTGSPRTSPATPGKPVTWTLTPSNQSNQTVDTITVTDMFDGPNQSYLDFAALSVTTAPPTTTSTTINYWVGGGWTTTLPPDPADVGGVQVIFSGSYAPGVSGTVTVNEVINDTADTLAPGAQVTVTDTATATVSKGAQTSAPVSDSAKVTISQSDPTVGIVKTISDATLTVGQDFTMDITATVGPQNVHELVIHEPTTGTDDFATQGVVFNGFNDVQWPIGAERAAIAYTYSDCIASSDSTLTENSLPAPTANCTVTGFTVTFTAPAGPTASRASRMPTSAWTSPPPPTSTSSSTAPTPSTRS